MKNVIHVPIYTKKRKEEKRKRAFRNIGVCRCVYLRNGKSDLVRLRCDVSRLRCVAIAMLCDAMQCEAVCACEEQSQERFL